MARFESERASGRLNMADRQVLCKSSSVTLVSSKSLALRSNGTVAGRKSKLRVLSASILLIRADTYDLIEAENMLGRSPSSELDMFVMCVLRLCLLYSFLSGGAALAF